MQKLDYIDIRKKRGEVIVSTLKNLFPTPKIALKYGNTWELLVAVILSAQCTDARVNIVTSELFTKYKTVEDYANADLTEFEKDIKSTGFYHNKAKNILATAKIILEKYQGKVPDDMTDLLELPGVARKTANVVLGVEFHKVEGIAVDTHVRRLSLLHGLTVSEDPVQIEKDLMEILPKSEWVAFTLRIIEYGRTFCPAKKHIHEECPLKKALKNAGI